MMRLESLIQGNPEVLETHGDMQVEIASVTNNSREIVHHGLFFCITGLKTDAHDFAPHAIENGCIALVVERFLDLPVPQVRVARGRAAMARISSAFFGEPSKALKLMGITGTKGKTSTSYLLKSIVEEAGFACGMIGTTGSFFGDQKLEGTLTTPDPIELQRTLRQMVDQGIQVVVMEVSAHALDMNRLDGMVFDVGCFTNFSQDHLDYFPDMDAYFQAKALFFQNGMVRNAALNADDVRYDQLKGCVRGASDNGNGHAGDRLVTQMTYGISNPSDVFARNLAQQVNGMGFDLHVYSDERTHVQLQLSGIFNVYNALAAASCALLADIDLDTIKRGLEAVENVPGRVETLSISQPYKVMLDYSHSPDSLTNILDTARSVAENRVIVVFGCGGNRDRKKRPIMGAIAGRKADFTVLTSDNPRDEEPMIILNAIEEGIRTTEGEYVVIENRRDAIRYALAHAQEGDVVVLAGKGHETYQEIKGVKYPFDERQVVDDVLRDLKG